MHWTCIYMDPTDMKYALIKLYNYVMTLGMFYHFILLYVLLLFYNITNYYTTTEYMIIILSYFFLYAVACSSFIVQPKEKLVQTLLTEVQRGKIVPKMGLAIKKQGKKKLKSVVTFYCGR